MFGTIFQTETSVVGMITLWWRLDHICPNFFLLPTLSASSRCHPVFSCVLLPPVNSYGATDEDEDDLTSSDSGDEVLKQFEISVSRSQSFRCATPAAAPAAVGEDEQRSQKAQHSLGRRHKFTRLSEQEEGSTEPSDCEGEVLNQMETIACAKQFHGSVGTTWVHLS